MPFIVECPNPFQPFKELRKTEVPVGTVIRHWLLERFPGFLEFDKPTVCLCNGDPLLRKDWNRKLEDGDMRQVHDDMVLFLRSEHAGRALWKHLSPGARMEMIETILREFNE